MNNHFNDRGPDINPKCVKEIAERTHDDASENLHFVDLLHIDESNPDISHAKATPSLQHQTAFLFILSAVIHFLMFYGISVKLNVPSFTDNAPKTPTLRASLYHPPLEHRHDTQGATEAENRPPLASTEVEKVARPEHSKNPKGATREYIGIVSTLEEPVAQETAIHRMEEPHKAPVNETKKSSRSIFTSTASEYLRQLEKRKLNRVASHALNKQRYNATHPEIKASPKNVFTQDEQLLESVKIEVDCNTTAGKFFSFISANVGVSAQDRYFPEHHALPDEPMRGTVKCRREGEIESFINNRIGK